MSGRTLVLGDWGRVVRDPIDLLRAAFFAGALVFAVRGELGGVANLLFAGGALLIARAVNLPRLYDLGFTIALILTGWGEALGLYDAWKPYDNVVHFVVPMLCSQVAYIALAPDRSAAGHARAIHAPPLRGHLHVTLALGVAIGGIWEILEYSSDRLFDSNLQLSNRDTVGDLIADTLGSATGGLLLVAWTKFGWGSVRRIPGQSRYEETRA